VNAQFGRDFDLLLTPTMAVATPEVGVVYDEANETPDAPRLTEARQVAFTAWVNIAGLPAISLPVHTDERGLPVGFGEVRQFPDLQRPFEQRIGRVHMQVHDGCIRHRKASRI